MAIKKLYRQGGGGEGLNGRFCQVAPSIILVKNVKKCKKCIKFSSNLLSMSQHKMSVLYDEKKQDEKNDIFAEALKKTLSFN